MKSRKVIVCIFLVILALMVDWNIRPDGKVVYGKQLITDPTVRQKLIKHNPKQWGKSKSQYEIKKAQRDVRKPERGGTSQEVPGAKPVDKPQNTDNPKPSSPPSSPPKHSAPVQKVVYLTFDDGPSFDITPKILDILKSEDVKATFFVIARNAEKNPEVLKRIIAEGHTIGNHTYSHDASAMYASMDVFKEEVNEWQEPVKKILGDDFSTKIFRFPGGLFRKHAEEAKWVGAMGYKIYDWNCNSLDAEHPEYPPERLFENVKKTMGDKTTVIVLNHDSESMQNTLNSIKREIDYMKSKGYTFAKLK